MSWHLNKFQQHVLRVYGDGDYSSYVAHAWSDENDFDRWAVRNLGDTLLLFVMRELSSEVFDTEAGSANDEATRLLTKAIEDLQNLLPVVALC